MTKQQLEMKICQARATVALLKAEQHVTDEAERHLENLKKVLVNEQYQSR